MDLARSPTPWSRNIARSASRSSLPRANASPPGPAQSAAPGAAQPRRQCGHLWRRRAGRRSATTGGAIGHRGRPTRAREFPEAELARVQEPFYRIEPSRSRETGGSGLGLTLARAAAQAHGGSLELENRPGGGLCARILLPGADPRAITGRDLLRREALHHALAAPELERMGPPKGPREADASTSSLASISSNPMNRPSGSASIYSR